MIVLTENPSSVQSYNNLYGFTSKVKSGFKEVNCLFCVYFVWLCIVSGTFSVKDGEYTWDEVLMLPHCFYLFVS